MRITNDIFIIYHQIIYFLTLNLCWKTEYKTADMKERVRRLATGENAAHGALRQSGTPPTQTPQGTAIDDLVNKENLEDYFDNLAAAATTDKVVLEQLTSEIVKLTTNNEASIATNAKLAAEVTNLTRKLGRNTGGDTSSTALDKLSPSTCRHCKKEGFHEPYS